MKIKNRLSLIAGLCLVVAFYACAIGSGQEGGSPGDSFVFDPRPPNDFMFGVGVALIVVAIALFVVTDRTPD